MRVQRTVSSAKVGHNPERSVALSWGGELPDDDVLVWVPAFAGTTVFCLPLCAIALPSGAR